MLGLGDGFGVSAGVIGPSRELWALRRSAEHEKGALSIPPAGLSVRAAATVMDLTEREFPDWDKGVGRPRSLTLYQAVRMTLVRLRRNNTYQDPGEDFEVTRPTAWNNVQPIVAFLADLLGCDEQEDLPALVEGKVCLRDGALVVVFNWRHRTDLYPAKHRAAGMNIQVLVDLQAGHRRQPGVPRQLARHAMFPRGRAGQAAGTRRWRDRRQRLPRRPVTTPIKKQPGVELADTDRESSRQLAKIRIAVEWAIAHLKNWRILATRYRSDLARTTPISRPRRPAQAQRGTRRAPPDL